MWILKNERKMSGKGYRWRDHQHLEDREKALKAIDEIRAKGHVVHEYRLWSPSVAWPAAWPMISITC